MAKRRKKERRKKGKISLSKYFQLLKEGERVAIIRDLSFPASFPLRIHGMTGKIVGKRGNYYAVEIKFRKKKKIFFIHPIHLKKLFS